jgi:hypothetical protein
MTWNELFSHSFKALRPQTADIRHQVDFILPSMPMVDACRADDFDFFRPLIDSGDLTVEQMHHAAQRYHLGKTRSGQPIFWMIDDMLQPLDAHIGNNWISRILKQREPLLDCWQVQHCLFGLHLMMFDGRWMMYDGRWMMDEGGWMRDEGETPAICVVEDEMSAVVLSEVLPESIWMAYATTAHLVPDLFAPLEGQTVTIYPRTDPTSSTFLFFEELADQTRRIYDIDLRVDNTLEDHATDDQKERCIGLLEFITE